MCHERNSPLLELDGVLQIHKKQSNGGRTLDMVENRRRCALIYHGILYPHWRRTNRELPSQFNYS